MTLLHADSLWNLLWIIPLFLILLFLAVSRYRRTRKLLFPSLRAAAPFLNLSPARRTLRFFLLFLAVLFAVLAASGPAWGRRVLPDAGPGRDLMILFDVSRSMLSDDVKPDRLSQGKWLVRELVRTHPADRFGLIAFAGNAFLLCPLTIDKTSFLQLADSLDTDTIPFGGTDLQVALEAALRAFEGAQGAHKAVVVVTDGDELTGNASGVLKKLADAGIPLFVAGIGDPANPSVIRIRKPDGSTSILTDSEGNTVRSPLNETLLASLAEKTRGIYVRSTAAEPGVEEIDRAIARLDRRKAGDTGLSLTRPIERPGTFFALALLCLLLFLSLSEIRKETPPHLRNGGRAGLALLPFLAAAFFLNPETGFSAEGAASDPEPLPLSGNGSEETAPPSGGEEKKSPLAWFNAGVRAQKAKENDLAEAAYGKAVAAGGDPEILAGSFQNLGILKHLDARKRVAEAGTSLKGQDLAGAEKAVDESLARLAEAESLYRESFRYAALNGSAGPVARNQQILLRERKSAEELRKRIEELKKLQEQARKQAEKALQDQQKKQQQQDPNNQQQQKQQDQQKQQPQQQQQKSSEGGNREDAARQSAKEASDTAEKLGKKAEELSQQQLKDQAEKAGGEIRRAMDRQAEGKDREAEEHLKNAVRMLGGKDEGSDPDKQKNAGSKQQKDGSKDEKKDPGKDPDPSGKQQEGGEDRKEPSARPRPPAPAPGKPGTPEKKEDRSIDPAQADAILNAMERDEKELRDMIKEMQKRTMPQREPKKNW